jgi:hypothetical protein
MKCKKLGVLLAMVLVGVSVSPSWTVSAAESQNLPQQVLDISNGSDEIYGLGAPIEHVENPDERFSSGGVDHTHQYIVSNALKILNNDKGASILNTKAAVICEYTDWPDVLGNETDYGTFAGHFYDPDTGKNSVNAEKVQLQQLISDISHQLKTPMTTLRLTESAMEKAITKPQELKTLFHTNTAHLNKLEFLISSREEIKNSSLFRCAVFV